VLGLLAEIRPRWTLSGGGALAGVHLGHRTTRDLDLFFHGLRQLESALRAEIVRALEQAGLQVSATQTTPGFVRLAVRGASEEVVLDLVAEPVATIEDPREVSIAGQRVLVDTPHEILVNKLCALLSRSELRDLGDVRELLEHGGDFQRALGEAPRKDGGFSPLMLAWLLRDRPIRQMAAVDGRSAEEVAALERFRDELVARLMRASAPG
jgi:hypothetical protein